MGLAACVQVSKTLKLYWGQISEKVGWRDGKMPRHPNTTIRGCIQVQQSILFISTDFEQYLRLKSSLSEFACTYSVSLPEGVSRFNQQEFCLTVLNLSLILSNAGQEELLRSFRRTHPVPIIALCNEVSDSDVVRLLDAGADQVLSIQAPDEVLAAYAHTLINRYTLLDRIERERHEPFASAARLLRQAPVLRRTA